MAEEGFKRKLTAILSADVAGYSRLMADDEAATVRTLADYREVIATLTKQHHGRVVDSPGDNILAEFASVVDAVQCAVAVQKELTARNEKIDEKRRMEFRIGINLGDVIDEEERIYGDGVNIAARLEALSVPGGICVSKTAFDQIETKLPLGYEYLGEQKVKNIPKPVPAYRVLLDEAAAGKVTDKTRSRQLKWLWATAFGIVAILIAGFFTTLWYKSQVPPSPAPIKYPDKPSVAVLPFKNIGGGPEKDYIVDGITDKIINSLFQVPQLHIIASNSVYLFKDKPADIRQVSEALRARNVMEGSVQFADDRLRINAQLIDAVTGEHLWAEGYDGEISDLFAMQDDIAKKILTALQIKLTGDIARLVSVGTTNINAYLKQLKGQELFTHWTKDSNLEARKLALEVIELDPNYPMGYILLGWTYAVDARQSTIEAIDEESLKLAKENAEKALELNEFLSWSHHLLYYIYRIERKWDQAFSEIEKAVAIEPTSFFLYFYANVLEQSGNLSKAIETYEKAFKRDPLPPTSARGMAMVTYFRHEKYEKARDEGIKFLDHAAKFEPDINPYGGHILLTATYAMLDQMQNARKHAAEVKRLEPDFSMDQYEKTVQWKHKEQQERLLFALRKAGLK